LKSWQRAGVTTGRKVAPYAGAWIEISYVSTAMTEIFSVAPYAGAWIEISGSIICGIPSGRRSLRGSVDYRLNLGPSGFTESPFYLYIIENHKIIAAPLYFLRLIIPAMYPRKLSYSRFQLYISSIIIGIFNSLNLYLAI
jgi:hypothetical protein